MLWLKNKKIVAVHSGNFHPDDVFAVSTLSILFNDQIKVVRTRDTSFYPKADFVIDTGGVYDPATNRFDHHQEGRAGYRNDQISYSSFGLVWKEYGEKVCGSKKVADALDQKLVAVVDADDCGVSLVESVLPDLRPFMMTDVIYAISPTWKESDLDINELFLKAVEQAKKILEREIKITKDKIEAEDLVHDIYLKTEDKRLIIFDEISLPKSLLANYPEPLFAVYKDREGKMWRVITIQEKEGLVKCRKNFPENWWGKEGEALAKETGVSDSVFCRNGGIFAGAISKEGAIKLAKLCL